MPNDLESVNLINFEGVSNDQIVGTQQEIREIVSSHTKQFASEIYEFPFFLNNFIGRRVFCIVFFGAVVFMVLFGGNCAEIPKIMYHTQDSFKILGDDIDIKIDYPIGLEVVDDKLGVLPTEFFPQMFLFKKNFYLGTFRLKAYHSIQIKFDNGKNFKLALNNSGLVRGL